MASTNTVKIQDVELTSVRPTGTLRAFATINLIGPIPRLQVKVIAGRKGVFAALPTQKAQNSETYYPLMEANSEFQSLLNEAVNKAYREALDKIEAA